jgi:hypothetical protein
MANQIVQQSFAAQQAQLAQDQAIAFAKVNRRDLASYFRMQSGGGSTESAVKSFVDAFKDRREQRLEQLRNPPGADEEPATLCWGRAPSFPDSSTNAPDGGGFSIRDSDEEKDPPEEGKKKITLREKLRVVEKVKVAAEGDDATFVVVERMRTWVANGSDGYQYVMQFTPKGQKYVIAEGSQPPAI